LGDATYDITALAALHVEVADEDSDSLATSSLYL